MNVAVSGEAAQAYLKDLQQLQQATELCIISSSGRDCPHVDYLSACAYMHVVGVVHFEERKFNSGQQYAGLLRHPKFSTGTCFCQDPGLSTSKKLSVVAT